MTLIILGTSDKRTRHTRDVDAIGAAKQFLTYQAVRSMKPTNGGAITMMIGITEFIIPNSATSISLPESHGKHELDAVIQHTIQYADQHCRISN